MAKGQLRSNREAKKPKQPKKPVVPASTFAVTMAKDSSHRSDHKKK
ncbi:MAG: hypothetical protein HZB57_02665 [Gammaproteobacteria bacterium]|nr:hypothetical protein [Gammaproteobacteria bacterium]